MPRIVLTPEQLRIIAQSQEPIEVQDDQGRVLARIIPLNAAELEAIERHKRRRGQPREPGIPLERVQAFLQRLDQLDVSEGVDEVKVRELLQETLRGHG